jgi:hypothetical protein
VLEVILGAVIAIVITICVENARKPKLELSIEAPVDMTYPAGSRPAKRSRYLHVRCKNRSLPWALRWISRNAALQCHGTVTFYHLDGQNVFGRSMPIRWSESPEPVSAQIQIGNQIGTIFDPQRFNTDSRIDIYPGEDSPLDIAVKFNDEPDCYGWSNLNYFSNPLWRNPSWKLLADRYLVKVSVISAGEKCEDVFRLINDVSQSDFRLERALSADRVRA